jgi:GNAT superfamily N-acetyltransferase
MDKLKIRRYKPSDNDKVWELHLKGLAQNGIMAGRKDEWAQDLNNIEKVYLEGGDYLVGEIDREVVAMGALKKIDEGTAEIKRMRVEPLFQGRGYGQAILEALEKKAIELGYKKMILDTSERWIKAQSLYKKNGYIEVGRKELSPRYHAIYYQKDLI